MTGTEPKPNHCKDRPGNPQETGGADLDAIPGSGLNGHRAFALEVELPTRAVLTHKDTNRN
jgi:hypothetical protein